MFYHVSHVSACHRNLGVGRFNSDLFFQEAGCKGKDTSDERDSEEDSDIERQSMMVSTGKLQLSQLS